MSQLNEVAKTTFRAALFWQYSKDVFQCSSHIIQCSILHTQYSIPAISNIQKAFPIQYAISLSKACPSSHSSTVCASSSMCEQHQYAISLSKACHALLTGILRTFPRVTFPRAHASSRVTFPPNHFPKCPVPARSLESTHLARKQSLGPKRL